MAAAELPVVVERVAARVTDAAKELKSPASEDATPWMALPPRTEVASAARELKTPVSMAEVASARMEVAAPRRADVSCAKAMPKRRAGAKAFMIASCKMQSVAG